MKKLTTIFIMLLFVSCVDLVEKPEGILAPETLFNSEAGFNTAITGIYFQLYNGYEGFDYAYPLLVGGGAEDISTNHAYKVFKGLDELKPTPETPALGSVWRISYLAIASANNIIQNSAGDTGLQKEKVESFAAEAKFLRAFCYFNLTRWFGKVPLITEENQLIADRVDESDELNIYKQIIEDLQYAESKLPTTTELKSRPNQLTAKALLAKVYLTMAGYPIKDNSKYSLARDKANEVITSGSYSLEANYGDLWLTSKKLNNKESMFGFFGTYNLPSVGSHLHLASRPWEGEGGWGDFFTEPRFLAAFPNGPRKDASFFTVFKNGVSWDNSAEGVPFIAKYRDAGAACGPDDTSCTENGEGFFTVLRYADVLLLFAEAANMADGGPSSAAYEAINKVRRRAAGLNPNLANNTVDLSGLSKNSFDAAVLDERNWELAFEGNRWFDLVRKELVVSVNSSLYPYVDTHNMLLPKPASELAISKGKINQNPGY